MNREEEKETSLEVDMHQSDIFCEVFEQRKSAVAVVECPLGEWLEQKLPVAADHKPSRTLPSFESL